VPCRSPSPRLQTVTRASAVSPPSRSGITTCVGSTASSGRRAQANARTRVCPASLSITRPAGTSCCPAGRRSPTRATRTCTCPSAGQRNSACDGRNHSTCAVMRPARGSRPSFRSVRGSTRSPSSAISPKSSTAGSTRSVGPAGTSAAKDIQSRPAFVSMDSACGSETRPVSMLPPSTETIALAWRPAGRRNALPGALTQGTWLVIRPSMSTGPGLYRVSTTRRVSLAPRSGRRTSRGCTFSRAAGGDQGAASRAGGTSSAEGVPKRESRSKPKSVMFGWTLLVDALERSGAVEREGSGSPSAVIASGGEGAAGGDV